MGNEAITQDAMQRRGVDVWEAFVVAGSRIVGRLSGVGDHVKDLTPAEVLALLGAAPGGGPDADLFMLMGA